MNVRISTAWRTALIPDVVVLDRRPVELCSPADALALAVEVWSPGDPCAERETRLAAYALAGVPFLWTLDRHAQHDLRLTAYRLENGQYTVENALDTESPATVTAGPVPITLDLAELIA